MLFENNLSSSINQKSVLPNLFDFKSEPDEGILFEEDKETNIFEEPPETEHFAVPIIRALTPVRKKDSVFKHLFPIPQIKTKIDYSDEEEVNERVRKLISSSSNVDYSDEPEIVTEAVLNAFEHKYKTLSENYPKFTIEFNRKKKLNTIHRNYHNTIRTIYANMNIGQTRLGYVLVLLFTEIICIKVFNLPFSGLTKMEMKRMYKYNSLMIELGEATYPATGDEGEPEAIEWRIAKIFLWNIFIFLSIKLLSNHFGGESMIDSVRTIIDKLFDNNINVENIENGEAKTINNEDNDLFSGLFDGDGSEFAEFVSSLGSNFTKNMENNRKGPQPRKKTNVIFDE